MDDPNFNPFELKSAIRNSPSPTPAKPKSSGYSMGKKKLHQLTFYNDFLDLDDPNFNPFKSKKSLPNVELSPEEVSPQNLTKTISKSDLNTTTGSDDFHSGKILIIFTKYSFL